MHRAGLDLRSEVQARLPVVMQMWPQIDPWNVWRLPLGMWEVLVTITDERVRQAQERAARDGR